MFTINFHYKVHAIYVEIDCEYDFCRPPPPPPPPPPPTPLPKCVNCSGVRFLPLKAQLKATSVTSAMVLPLGMSAYNNTIQQV